MKQPKRLTRAEKIAIRKAAAEGQPIADPRALKILPPGTYTMAGEAAAALHKQTLKRLT
jgi:hypothetical protein